MSVFLIRTMLVLALALLAMGTWISQMAVTDAMFIFAAFAIGGVWAKYSSAGTATS